MIKNLPTMWEIWIWSLGWEDPLEKSMANHSSILAWRIPWTEETGGLQSLGSERVRHYWMTNAFTFTCTSSSPSPVLPTLSLPTPNSSGNHQCVTCICESVSVLFCLLILFFFKISRINEIIWYLSSFDLFYSTKYLWCLSVLSQMACFHSV